MGLTSVKRRSLVFFLFFLSILTIILFASCFIPKWWIIEYKNSKTGQVKNKITIGLFRTCHDDRVKNKEVCNSHDQDDFPITGLHAIRGFLISGIALCMVNIILAIILLFNHTLKVLLWLIGAIKTFAWLICVLLAVCIGFSLTGQSDPKIPSWVDQNISGESSIDYGFAFISTCIGLILSITVTVIICVLLGFTIKYRLKYSDLETNESSTTTSSTEETHTGYYDWNTILENLANRNAVKNGETRKNERSFKPRFTHYKNRGFLPSKRNQSSSLHRDGLIREFTKQFYYQQPSGSNHTEVSNCTVAPEQPLVSRAFSNPHEEIERRSSVEPLDTRVRFRQPIVDTVYFDQPAVIYRYNGQAGPEGWKKTNQAEAWSGIKNEEMRRRPTFINAIMDIDRDCTTRPHNNRFTIVSSQPQVQDPLPQVLHEKSHQEYQYQDGVRNVYTGQYTDSGKRKESLAKKTGLVQDVAIEPRVFNVAYKNHGFPEPDY